MKSMESKTIEQIQGIMQENHIMGEAYCYAEGVVEVQIDLGDWKHDHLRLVLKVQERIGWVDEYIQLNVDGNDSDCYSATHRFYLNKDCYEKLNQVA